MNKEEELLKILEDCREEYDNVSNNLPFGLDWDEYQESMKPYSKKIGEASRNYRMVQTPVFTNDIPDFGDVMSLKKFISCCEEGGFINYDGFGEYIKDGKRSGIEIYPSDVKHNAIRNDFTEIIWFNR